MDATAILARWWRKSQRHLPQKQIGNPHTFLTNLSKTPEAKVFLQQKVTQLRLEIEQDPTDDSSHALLSSFLEKLDDIDGAIEHIEKAINLDGEFKKYQLTRERLLRQKQAILDREQFAKTLKLQNETQEEEKRIHKKKNVQKIHCSELSVPQFIAEFEEKSIPVIITGLLAGLTSERWTFDLLKQKIGSAKVELKRSVSDSLNWARLESASSVSPLVPSTLGEFIDSLPNPANAGDTANGGDTASTGDTEKLLYLHDWSLPLNGPEMLDGFSIPKYFAHDFLQKTPPHSLYRDSWPSLFIGPKQSKSDLHIDTFHSNFWMGLFEGRKRWIFFPPDETCLLYPSYKTDNLDPVFEADVSILLRQQNDIHMDGGRHTDTDTGTEKDNELDHCPTSRNKTPGHGGAQKCFGHGLNKNTPLFQFAHPYICDLAPGEILFVPAGTPHYVENLDDTLAISGNYLSRSNFSGALSELEINGFVNERAHSLYKFLDANKENLLNSSLCDENIPYCVFHSPPKTTTDDDHVSKKRRIDG